MNELLAIGASHVEDQPWRWIAPRARVFARVAPGLRVFATGATLPRGGQYAFASGADYEAELGLALEGRTTIEGEWAGRVTGLRDQRVEIAMMRTPDGLSRLEISRFLAPPVAADHRSAPVNTLGYLRVMFTVEDIDDTLARLRKRGAQLVGEVVRYEDTYRLCYIRGPEGLLIGLAQELGRQTR